LNQCAFANSTWLEVVGNPFSQLLPTPCAANLASRQRRPQHTSATAIRPSNATSANRRATWSATGTGKSVAMNSIQVAGWFDRHDEAGPTTMRDEGSMSACTIFPTRPLSPLLLLLVLLYPLLGGLVDVKSPLKRAIMSFKQSERAFMCPPRVEIPPNTPASRACMHRTGTTSTRACLQKTPTRTSQSLRTASSHRRDQSAAKEEDKGWKGKFAVNRRHGHPVLTAPRT